MIVAVMLFYLKNQASQNRLSQWFNIMNAKQILSKLIADLSLQVAETQEALAVANAEIERLTARLMELENEKKQSVSERS